MNVSYRSRRISADSSLLEKRSSPLKRSTRVVPKRANEIPPNKNPQKMNLQLSKRHYFIHSRTTNTVHRTSPMYTSSIHTKHDFFIASALSDNHAMFANSSTLDFGYIGKPVNFVRKKKQQKMIKGGNAPARPPPDWRPFAYDHNRSGVHICG